MIILRPMNPADIAAVIAIQAECYLPAMVEPAATLHARLAAAPDCAWVAEGEAGVLAYLVGYPSERGRITPLGGAFEVSDSPDSLYLHDLAVSRRAAGMGVGSALVGHALERAAERGLAYSSLVSVQGTLAFWQARGYRSQPSLTPAQAALLATYAGPASYMVKPLG